MAKIVIAEEYGYVVLTTVSSGFLMMYLAFNVGRARKKFSVFVCMAVDCLTNSKSIFLTDFQLGIIVTCKLPRGCPCGFTYS